MKSTPRFVIGSHILSLLSNIGGAQVDKDLETLRLGTRQMQRYGEIQRLTNTQSSACKTQWWEWLWIKSEYTAGKVWGWSKVSPTSPRDMLKVVNTLPGSDTGFLHRVFGKTCGSIVTLQNVLLTLAHLRCSCGSYHMKRTKVNILRQLSLSPYRQLKHIKAHWSWRKCLRYRGIRHLFTSPRNLLRGHPNICFDVGSLGVKIEMVWNRTQSCDLEPGEREIAVENLKPSKHTTGKAFQTCNFLLANHNDENDLDSNPNAIQEGWCWSTTTPRPDSKVRFPRGSG